MMSGRELMMEVGVNAANVVQGRGKAFILFRLLRPGDTNTGRWRENWYSVTRFFSSISITVP
jgi:hypothetical protein